jgi:GTPase SAR1 family protein
MNVPKYDDLSPDSKIRNRCEGETMKIAITGKGGVGKTTFAAILSRLYASEGYRVLAFDADPDPIWPWPWFFRKSGSLKLFHSGNEGDDCGQNEHRGGFFRKCSNSTLKWTISREIRDERSWRKSINHGYGR